jgi:hypothetical protein
MDSTCFTTWAKHEMISQISRGNGNQKVFTQQNKKKFPTMLAEASPSTATTASTASTNTKNPSSSPCTNIPSLLAARIAQLQTEAQGEEQEATSKGKSDDLFYAVLL